MQPLPRICVIILNYFGADKTTKCIKSLRSEPISILYLVDNSASSAENSRLQTLVTELKQSEIEFPIHLLLNKTNLGFAKGVNQAIANDLGTPNPHTHYLLLNNDVIVQAGLLSTLYYKMQQDPKVVLASPNIQSDSGSRCVVWYQRISGHIEDSHIRFAFPFLSGCCLLADARLVRDSYLLDEDFFMYGEDVELGWRVLKNNKKSLCVENVSIYHEGTGSSKLGGLFYEYHMIRGHIILAGKVSDSVSEKVFFFIGRFAYLFSRSIVRSIRYRSVIPLIAFTIGWFPLNIRSQSLSGANDRPPGKYRQE